ncbi:hypothetical protein [Gordonia caeni]|uniref:DUF4352 domain-containing protein n=1 Tax=Gordonia caeni TaxID=1007097 RepID=A0ABP7NPC8_9ACTN
MDDPNARIDPGAIKHPGWTAAGVIVMLAVIVAGVVLWARGSSEAVRISEPSLGAPVTLDGGRTAIPVEATIANQSDEPIRVTELKVDVLSSRRVGACFTAPPEPDTVTGTYSVALPMQAGVPTTGVTTVPYTAEVPAGTGGRLAFTVGPQTQDAGTVIVTVFRPVVVLDDGAELGLPSVATATTPEGVQRYVDGVQALTAAERAAQSACAGGELATFDDVYGTSSLQDEPLKRLRESYTELAGKN